MTSLGLPQFLAASGQRLVLALVDGGSHSYWQAHDDGDPGRMVVEEFLPLARHARARCCGGGVSNT